MSHSGSLHTVQAALPPAEPAALGKCMGEGGVGDNITVDEVIEHFKEKNGLCCLAGARTNMKKSRKTSASC